MMGRRLAAAMALTIFSGCATDPSTGLLSVLNHTDRALAAFAFPNGTLVDPIPHLPPGSYDENLILAGQRLVIDSVPGYVDGEGVYLFVYVVERQGADLIMGMAVTDAQLKFFRGQVSIDVLPSPRMIPP